jgi:hypothetical protein
MASCHFCGNAYYEERGIEFYSGSVRHVPTSVCSFLIRLFQYRINLQLPDMCEFSW